MWASILAALTWDALKTVFSGWWAGFTRKKDIKDAVEPYKAETEALAKPAGSDDDVINKL